MKLRMHNWLLWVLTANILMTPYFTYGFSYIHWLTECHLLHCSQVAAETKCSFEWLLYSTQARFWTSFSKWLQKSELRWLIAALGSGLRLFAWGTEQATGHSTNQSPSFCHCIESSTARAAMSLETTFSGVLNQHWLHDLLSSNFLAAWSEYFLLCFDFLKALSKGDQLLEQLQLSCAARTSQLNLKIKNFDAFIQKLVVSQLTHCIIHIF